MRAKGTPRLQRIRLVMLLSLFVLAGFLGYWLHSEYLRERESLRKDMTRTLNQVQSRLVDSLIMRDVIRPIIKTVDLLSKDGITLSDVSPGSIRGEINHTPEPDTSVHGIFAQDSSQRRDFYTDPARFIKEVERFPERFLKSIKADSVHSLNRGIQTTKFFFSRDSISPDSYTRYSRETMIHKSDSVHLRLYSGDSVQNHDSRITIQDTVDTKLIRSIELMIQTMSDIPGAAKRNHHGLDTTSIRNEFLSAIKNAGISGMLHWAPDSLISRVDGLRLDDSTSPRYTAYVTSYESNLIRRTSPQLLFSAFLLCLTALAFGMTFRALRSQIQLATIRNDFISNMSHELKTPVSTVKVALEAISEPAVLNDPELAGEYLEMAGLELGRLELLINQALQTALLEEGRLTVERQPVDLAQLSAQMLRIMQTRFSQQGGRIAISEAGDSFRVTGDALHLQGVIVNMLDNALKYAGPEPRVKMELHDRFHCVRLRICDHGPGIPAQYRAKIFDKFFRVPKGNEHSVKGYGLGLAYAAQIIRMHDGTISVSENPGGGCCFELTLPKQQA
jgi:signal transduction histidine kinase